ncbi:DUF302 domain-containing protein [Sphaerisporangium corydalis]|uniref:DUF302 domain-containing protein n=1 Tax=Sphaerisporangium corydalis TaxID=1441875 RepID=A0ABV9EM88_9ACTN|nr:DUF302 domain-containing protein [Sphaerisporangium corydalis]
MDARVRSVPHEVNRLAVAADEPFDVFRDRYERAVPEFDIDVFQRLVDEAAGWDAVLRATAEAAPHDFLIYWSGDFAALLGLAGEHRRCVQYLMGNHTIVQRMYHHDASVMLYAPLRTAIYEDAEGRTWFTVDQPSTRFSSFGRPEIAEVGVELDRKLAALLGHLQMPVPASLNAPA